MDPKHIPLTSLTLAILAELDAWEHVADHDSPVTRAVAEKATEIVDKMLVEALHGTAHD